MGRETLAMSCGVGYEIGIRKACSSAAVRSIQSDGWCHLTHHL